MTERIYLTIPVDGGGYARITVFVRQITMIVPVTKGPDKKLTRVFTTDDSWANVEETQEQINELIDNALRDRSNFPAQRDTKKSWWPMGQRG